MPSTFVAERPMSRNWSMPMTRLARGVTEHSREMLEAPAAQHAKANGVPYMSGRRLSWLKVKNLRLRGEAALVV